MPQKPEHYKNIIDEFYEGGDDARPEPDDTEKGRNTDANADRSTPHRQSSTDGRQDRRPENTVVRKARSKPVISRITQAVC